MRANERSERPSGLFKTRSSLTRNAPLWTRRKIPRERKKSDRKLNHLIIFRGVSSQRRSRFERATRSLATFVRSHRSLRSLAPQRSASLRSLRSLAPFTGSLTHFAHSLVGQLKFLNMCSHCYRVSRVQTRCLSSLETRSLSPVSLAISPLSPLMDPELSSRMIMSFGDEAA